MTNFLTLDDFEPNDKQVLVRVDFNVPMQDGKVTDTTRIERSALTLSELKKRQAKIILLSHFGRPNGHIVPDLSLKPILPILQKIYGSSSVFFAKDCIGADVVEQISKLTNGQILLLENIRFYKEEEINDLSFAKNLANLAHIYINDAFSCAHRAHASTEGITHFLPAYAGRLMQTELEHLHQILDNPKRPLIAIIGGAKISTKLDLIANLMNKVDFLVIGGAMANTFLYAQGHNIGTSLYEKEMITTAKTILAQSQKSQCKIILPSDVVVANNLKDGHNASIISINSIPNDKMILDIGPQTVQDIIKLLSQTKSLVWNGPCGAFEYPPFEKGTEYLSQEVSQLTQAKKIISVAGGGDTVAALSMFNLNEKFTYVSTAGGAFLEWLEGKKLPGIEALCQQKFHT
ncbi:MAG: phosphoglycerate kinase [Alphaproteobacteria bacterium]|nr:phosphoglycerate kinase [Alphaproteobacteria bacterium]